MFELFEVFRSFSQRIRAVAAARSRYRICKAEAISAEVQAVSAVTSDRFREYLSDGETHFSDMCMLLSLFCTTVTDKSSGSIFWNFDHIFDGTFTPVGVLQF